LSIQVLQGSAATEVVEVVVLLPPSSAVNLRIQH